MSATASSVTGGVGASQLLSALQNVVTALNNASTTFLNVQGQATVTNISVPTVISAKGGRIGRVSILTAGTGGIIYDSASLTNTSNPMYAIPATAGDEPYFVGMPVSFGVLVVPGSGVVSVSYS
jgi:hypothetical protein